MAESTDPTPASAPEVDMAEVQPPVEEEKQPEGEQKETEKKLEKK
mgnify:CR=1 FL=1